MIVFFKIDFQDKFLQVSISIYQAYLRFQNFILTFQVFMTACCIYLFQRKKQNSFHKTFVHIRYKIIIFKRQDSNSPQKIATFFVKSLSQIIIIWKNYNLKITTDFYYIYLKLSNQNSVLYITRCVHSFKCKIVIEVIMEEVLIMLTICSIRTLCVPNVPHLHRI